MVVASSSAGGAGARHSSAMSFGVQFITGRLFMVYATLVIMAASGATYMFGVYSGEIKSTLGYSQTTLNLLSFFKDVGTTVGIPSGLLMEVTPPWMVLATGAVLNFFDYFMIWLAVTGRIAKPAVWQMCLYICVGANSQMHIKKKWESCSCGRKLIVQNKRTSLNDFDRFKVMLAKIKVCVNVINHLSYCNFPGSLTLQSMPIVGAICASPKGFRNNRKNM